MARGRNVRLAIIDSGVDATHPELKGAAIRDLRCRRFGQGRARSRTARRSPASSARASSSWALRPTPASSPCGRSRKVRPGRSEGTTETLIKGIDAALGKGVRLFNLSFTGPRDPSVEQIIRIAEGKGAMFIAAAAMAGPARRQPSRRL